jgi:protein tyrosine/serine phosphatase
VSRPASRASVGKVLATIAASTHPVLIHCLGGKDRTGWLSDLLQRLAGVRQAQRDADYLATKAYSGGAVNLAWLQAARDQLRTDYGSIDAYLTKGCGLSAQTVAQVRARVKPR